MVEINEDVVIAENICKKYETKIHKGFFKREKKVVTALRGVSLNVKEGEIFGLLGPNGAGKTTLIKILTTLLLPDSGRALIYGLDVVKHAREVKKEDWSNAYGRKSTILEANWERKPRIFWKLL